MKRKVAMDGQEALRRLAAEAESGELIFSTNAHVALQVRMALDDPDLHLNDAAKAVHAEPLLAARVVSLANSVTFNRSGKSIADVRTAIGRVGVNTTRALSTALVMRQMSSVPANPAHEALAARLWEHTSHVAALCYVLARRVSRQNPDIAMFAGIVHEVGGFYLISRANAYPSLLDNGVSPAWTAGGEAQITNAVLRALSVPDDVATAVRALWGGTVALPPASLADTLYLADRLTPIANPLHVASDIHHAEMLATTEQVMANQALAAVIDESAEELDAIAATLRI
jgi:HD-like signal output (HDOD) protein